MGMINVLAAVLLPVFAAIPLHAAETPLSAVIGEINGAVYARASGSAAWAAVKNGDTIAPGSEVRTARGGGAVVAFSDNNKVKLGSATIFGVDGATTKKTAIRLVAGKITAWVKRANKADFTVRHRAGVAAVRGTTLGAEDSGSGLTFTLFEGAMDVTDAFGRTSSISPGQNANMSQEGGMMGISSLPPGTQTPTEPSLPAPPPPTTTAATPPAPTEPAAAPEAIAADEPAAATTASPVQESANNASSPMNSTVSPSAP